jgi:hypothetical protein
VTSVPEIDIWRAATLMLDRADELAARNNYHGQATWRRIIEVVGQLVNKTLPGCTVLTTGNFVPQIRPLPARWFHS